jgi:hypothetical protein
MHGMHNGRLRGACVGSLPAVPWPFVHDVMQLVHDA